MKHPKQITAAIIAIIASTVFAFTAVALTPHTSTEIFSATSGEADWDAFEWVWSSRTEAMNLSWPFDVSSGNVIIRMFKSEGGSITLEAGPFTISGSTNATLTIASTNIPVWATYYAEIGEVQETDPVQYKSLARGTISREWSAWDTTNTIGETTSVSLIYSYGTNNTAEWDAAYDWVNTYSNLTPTYTWVQSYVSTSSVTVAATNLTYYTLTAAVDASNVVQDAATALVQSNLTDHTNLTGAADAHGMSNTVVLANSAVQPTDGSVTFATDGAYVSVGLEGGGSGGTFLYVLANTNIYGAVHGIFGYSTYQSSGTGHYFSDEDVWGIGTITADTFSGAHTGDLSGGTNLLLGGLAQSGATNSQVVTWDAATTNWVAATPAAGGGSSLWTDDGDGTISRGSAVDIGGKLIVSNSVISTTSLFRGGDATASSQLDLDATPELKVYDSGWKSLFLYNNGSQRLTFGSLVTFFDANGFTGIGTLADTLETRLEVDGVITLRSSTQATAPTDGKAQLWLSNGNGAGNTGDVMVAINAGGVITTNTLFADSFQGARQDLGTTNTLVWLPTKYTAKWAPSGAATFAMDTNATYRRATYFTHILGTNAVTWDGNIEMDDDNWTKAATNYATISPGDTLTNWVGKVIGR